MSARQPSAAAAGGGASDFAAVQHGWGARRKRPTIVRVVTEYHELVLCAVLAVFALAVCLLFWDGRTFKDAAQPTNILQAAYV
ncbi:hypothetical protein DIPPA_00525 [Diplonema papillatum]|nr:hypothetical protein DIPPA_00525 [Diplonema papillatum]